MISHAVMTLGLWFAQVAASPTAMPVAAPTATATPSISYYAGVPESTEAIAQHCGTVADGRYPALSVACRLALAAYKHLPNLLCKETVHRTHNTSLAGAHSKKWPDHGWEPDDVLAVDVQFEEKGIESYTHLKRNGQPVNAPGALKNAALGSYIVQNFGGTWEFNELESDLLLIFDPRNHTSFSLRVDRYSEELVFRFRTNGQKTYSWQSNGITLHPDVEGTLWIDQATSTLSMLEFQTIDTTGTHDIEQMGLTASYAAVAVHGKRFLFPSLYTRTQCNWSSHTCLRNMVEFHDLKSLVAIPTPAPTPTPALAPPDAGIENLSCAAIDGHPELALLAKTCEFAVASPKTLPDFICQESVKRFSSQGLPIVWDFNDEIVAETRFARGLGPRYSHVASRKSGPIGLPADKQSTSEEVALYLNATIGGMWNLGELGSNLLFVFDPRSHAEFTPEARHSSTVFHYKIRREYSTYQWLVHESRTNPGAVGEVEIDKKTSLLKQFTLAADEIDPHFPMKSLTIETEYSMVPIANAGSFLLPHSSTSEQCFRDDNICYKNVVTFHDCRKFGSDTRILNSNSDKER